MKECNTLEEFKTFFLNTLSITGYMVEAALSEIAGLVTVMKDRREKLGIQN